MRSNFGPTSRTKKHKKIKTVKFHKERETAKPIWTQNFAPQKDR